MALPQGLRLMDMSKGTAWMSSEMQRQEISAQPQLLQPGQPRGTEAAKKQGSA